ncbi:Transposase [Cordylochernes scorpioides]|uniref:Transposase n=1 Tax=Cordylochernes scorpioides TaxID=51811 RepID=A0ABY6KUS4_9ARAC|nr:Transposase [Cordylochernes scorpioides]
MQEGTTDRRVRSHPPQCTTSRAYREIVRMTVTDRSVTAHSQSVLSARRPLLRLPLTQNHRRLRRQWYNERRMWTAEWNVIVFTDESRFCLQHHDGRIRVWRHRGERKLNSCVMHRHTGPALGIMVWGCIVRVYHSHTPAVRIAGTLNSQRYISEVLEPVVLLTFRACSQPYFNRIMRDHTWHALSKGHRKRRQFRQTDAFARGMVIGLKRAARVDRRILRQAVAAPQATCTAILQHVQDTLDHSISTRTISRRLVANGLHSCRPLRRLPLTPPNRRQRLEWCRARSTWMTEWHRVVFSDESRFCLSSDSRRVRVWRRRGERSNPAAIVERPTVRQRGIMVWGAIAYDSRSPLLRIQGTMTVQRYVDDVLRPVTLPYLQGVPNALYLQDNARPHTARISQQALQDIQMFPWPPYSPDLSPIEHVWDIIGRRLHALPQPRSEDELWQMVEREWRAIPQDAIRTLIDSLPRRVAACIAVRGGPTCY